MGGTPDPGAGKEAAPRPATPKPAPKPPGGGGGRRAGVRKSVQGMDYAAGAAALSPAGGPTAVGAGASLVDQEWLGKVQQAGSATKLAEAQRITAYYCQQVNTFCDGLGAAIQAAKENVQSAGQLKDDSFWADLATDLVIGGIELIPGGGRLARLLERWSVGKASSAYIEGLAGMLAKSLATTGLKPGSGGGPTLNLSLTAKAFQLHSRMIASQSSEAAYLNGLLAQVNLRPEVLDAEMLMCFRSLEGSAPIWTKATGEAFVIAFEKRLWPVWIRAKGTIVDRVSDVWGSHGQRLEGISEATLAYLQTRLGWSRQKVEGYVVNRRVERVGGGFGSLDNR